MTSTRDDTNTSDQLELQDKASAAPTFLDACVSRRRFLFLGATGVTTVTLASLVPGTLFRAEVAAFDDQRIGSLADLAVGEPVVFRYPWDHSNCVTYLIKLGERAAGGIGPDEDVVAFNTLCTHMGISLLNQYKSDHQVLGPCPAHLSTYDLTRHGMVVSGHATQGLPQVTLEDRGGDIYATGMLGLIYGFADNDDKPL